MDLTGCPHRKRWCAVGTIVVSTLVLAACGGARVDSFVKDYESATEVKSCHKIVDTITDDGGDYGVDLDEVWKCAVKLDGKGGFVDACYVFHNAAESSINRRIRCASVRPGCPLGGHRDRKAQTVFLGRHVDPTLVYEKALGNDPAYKTVRVEVSYHKMEGAKEHCGYLDVRVPLADDVKDPSQRPMALAAEIIKREWTERHYSFSYFLEGRATR
jgi:hypothetical protein